MLNRVQHCFTDMPSVIMLSVIKLAVVAPSCERDLLNRREPTGCPIRIFNSKLARFATKQGIALCSNTARSRVANSAQVSSSRLKFARGPAQLNRPMQQQRKNLSPVLEKKNENANSKNKKKPVKTLPIVKKNFFQMRHGKLS